MKQKISKMVTWTVRYLATMLILPIVLISIGIVLPAVMLVAGIFLFILKLTENDTTNSNKSFKINPTISLARKDAKY